MKHSFQHYLFLVLTSLGVICQLDATPTSEIHYALPKDGRKWKIAFQSKPDDPQSITQIILENETPESATELITLQTIPGISLEPEQFFNLLMKQIQQSLPKNKVESKIISSSPQSMLAEWWIHENTAVPQHEWMRIIKKEDTLAILRYTTKDIKGIETSRSTWEKILQEAQ